MFGAVSFRKQGFANSLILRIGWLILFALAAFTLSLYLLIGRPTIDRLAESQMRLMSEQLEARLGRLFKSVEATLHSSQSWGMNGGLDQSQLLRFNEFFFPIIANHGEIASVIFAHESGREILLMHGDDGRWINRISDPDHFGQQTYWITWSPEREIEQVEIKNRDYDARTRPWFKGAMALDDNRKVFWTEPYVFFTAQEAGITAAMKWQGADGSNYVIGHDVKLSDIAEYTSQLGIGHGKSALLSSDGKLLSPLRMPVSTIVPRSARPCSRPRPNLAWSNWVAPTPAGWPTTVLKTGSTASGWPMASSGSAFSTRWKTAIARSG